MSLASFNIKYFLTFTIAMLGGFFVSQTVNAQHADIWLVLNGNQTAASPTNIETTSPVLIDLASGKFLFTGNFDDVGQGSDGTDDPGFQSEASTFSAGAILNFRAVGSLQYWNGNNWINTVVDQERIQIEDALSNMTIIDVNGATNAEGAIDQVAGDGSIHQHIDYTIDNSLGSGTIAPGAYMIELELFVTDGVGGPIVHTTSEPILIAFKYQLSSTEFDEAISQLTVPDEVAVPLPNLTLLILAALLGVISTLSRLFKYARNT